ncbi:hypothetical protein BJY21_002440 [Kineosphaera limosa]|uniref:Uncharacterized protein n=1 Tax=Kineosphaera limosa NBRC 100340 TaxID=1184609 RepID=K6WQ55_9MICO|nr:hypothetical protein [Kineosphaera limosa]NYE01256.1 hypothetical protein [Kineosphaera limosa]GAB95946.1 hypothetical protein KILIM_029_00560 [Kineosphaera limosa NBRC 100340]
MAGREIRYDTRGNRPRWVIPLLLGIVTMSVVQVGVSLYRWGFQGVTVASTFWLVWLLLLLILLLRRTEIVVDAAGIRRPYLPRIDWGAIAAVSRPRPTDDYVRLIPNRGRRRVAIGLPVRYAKEAAKIGKKSLRD